MSTATTKQIQFITDLRGTDPLPVREDVQATTGQITQILFDADFKQAMRTARADAKEKGLTGADRKAAIEQANTDFTAAHPLDSYQAEAQAILDADWATWHHAWTIDPATLTKDEASSLIDRLQAEVPATQPVAGELRIPAAILDIRATLPEPTEAEDEDAPAEVPAPEQTPAERRAHARAITVLPAGTDPAPLTAWALAWHAAAKADHAYPVDGVLVAADGSIVGETRNQDGTYRLTEDTRQRHGLERTVLDMSLGALRDSVGQDVYHYRSWEVAPSRPRMPETLRHLEDAAGQKAEADMLITELLAQGRREGIAVATLAKAAGLKSRQAVYDRLADKKEG